MIIYTLLLNKGISSGLWEDIVKTMNDVGYELVVATDVRDEPLVYITEEGSNIGYRIAGPKALGGVDAAYNLRITMDDFVEFITYYAPELRERLQAELCNKSAKKGSK